jgi:hypothetical protein
MQELNEEDLLANIKNLIDVWNELDILVKSGYDGAFMGEDIRPLMKAYRKAKWKLDE